MRCLPAYWVPEARANKKGAPLRHYVLFLANTGVRHGTEALGLRWRNIEWQEKGGEQYLVVNVDGMISPTQVVQFDC